MAYRQVKSTNKFKAKRVAKPRHCGECKNEFTPQNAYGLGKFCSHKCANINRWKNHISKPKKIQTKVCDQCQKEFIRRQRCTNTQWLSQKFCSPTCLGLHQRVKDGMNKAERYRRKIGVAEKGSASWIEKLKAGTKAGMAKPEVKLKLSSPKGAWSDERKAIQSSKLTGVMPKNMIRSERGVGSYPNVHRGDYECSKGSVYFRSKWEANYALYLDFLVNNGDIKKWEYEVDVFVFEEIKFGNRSYRPDFKVFDKNDKFEYHEVKGHMDARSKTKLRRMDKYYPHIKIELIQRDRYMGILRGLKGIVNFYK